MNEQSEGYQETPKWLYSTNVGPVNKFGPVKHSQSCTRTLEVLRAKLPDSWTRKVLAVLYIEEQYPSSIWTHVYTHKRMVTQKMYVKTSLKSNRDKNNSRLNLMSF
jgi:hypothetical protein